MFAPKRLLLKLLHRRRVLRGTVSSIEQPARPENTRKAIADSECMMEPDPYLSSLLK